MPLRQLEVHVFPSGAVDVHQKLGAKHFQVMAAREAAILAAMSNPAAFHSQLPVNVRKERKAAAKGWLKKLRPFGLRTDRQHMLDVVEAELHEQKAATDKLRAQAKAATKSAAILKNDLEQLRSELEQEKQARAVAERRVKELEAKPKVSGQERQPH
jgi:hypothetical protein